MKHVHSEDKYEWRNINVFTRSLTATNQTIILIFDPPLSIWPHMPDPMFSPDLAQLSDPFWVYRGLLEEVVHLQDTAVWALRDQVRGIEKERQPVGKPQPDYARLHDIARHSIHVNETLEATLQTIGQIIYHHKAMREDTKIDQSVVQSVHARLQFFEGFINNLRCRSVSNKERLTNEIQLSFHTIAQYDAAMSVEIGRAAQSDNAAMKTIAFVTLAFLPPTFVSAIFSMSFFSYEDSGEWVVSEKFWIYWVCAVPTTVITTLLWYFWHKHYVKRV